MSADLHALARRVIAADKQGVARALNLVEDGRDSAQAQIAELLTELASAPRLAAGHRIGLTGPPGVGKSTLAAALARRYRERSRTVGVIAVDPSSVKSGGSLLGDRVRMMFDPADDGIFVRSLATAGQPGGISFATHAAVRVLAAAYDVVLIETTGVGQSEIDVVHVADTVVLVVQPGSGDVLQFLKAGIMEIPDVLVVNKADQGALAEQAVGDLRSALRTLGSVGAKADAQGWSPAVVSTSAIDGSGAGELVNTLHAHRASLGKEIRRRRDGEVAWALALVERRFGSFGVERLGGEAAVRREIEAEVGKGRPPPAVFEALGRRFRGSLGLD